jgi:hypothetical protein
VQEPNARSMSKLFMGSPWTQSLKMMCIDTYPKCPTKTT